MTPRSTSLANIDSEQASGLLGELFKEANVYLGGASVGQGLKHAARYHLQKRLTQQEKPDFFKLPGASRVIAKTEMMLLEDSFYVVDLGIIVSQFYQWRRYFPRVEPFYAVKCNPDPIIVKTLATLGCNFDCASRQEIRLVQAACEELPRQPEIIYANPCKGRGHLLEAVCRGVQMVTFDNAAEVEKCAAISPDIKLILRIITDDRGSQCRLSSKFGSPRHKWRPLLAAAKKHGLQVVGVSFHVGSGCRDASRYEMALKDAKEIFEMAEKDFDMKMTLLDIGGGFPGETHSLWNPAAELDASQELDAVEGKPQSDDGADPDAGEDRFMFFTEIAEQVAPVLDTLFPESSGVRIIGEPGRYMVAASATLCCSVIANRTNQVDNDFNPEPVNDREAAKNLNDLTRTDQEEMLTRNRQRSLSFTETDNILSTIQEQLADYSKLFASQQLAQQEVDVYADRVDLFKENYESSTDLLGPPLDDQKGRKHHTVEGMTYPLVEWAGTEEEGSEQADTATALLTLAAAGEAAVNGVVLQAVADSAPLQDDYAYYVNDGVYGAFNNIMFDHASIRPRVLGPSEKIVATEEDGFMTLQAPGNGNNDDKQQRDLFASTVFGPTCDSIDVIARSVLLPKLQVGDWLYFQNMGAYTMAAASSFNGFAPSEKLYVCSVQPEYFEAMIQGPKIEEEGL